MSTRRQLYIFSKNLNSIQIHSHFYISGTWHHVYLNSFKLTELTTTLWERHPDFGMLRFKYQTNPAMVLQK